MLSSSIQPDVVEYLDTGRILAYGATGEPIMFAQPGPATDYWEGEGWAFARKAVATVRAPGTHWHTRPAHNGPKTPNPA
jgi:hypothetical protein